MYWRSFSKPVNGDGDGVAAVGAGDGLVFDVVSGDPPHEARSKIIVTSRDVFNLMVLLTNPHQSFRL